MKFWNHLQWEISRLSTVSHPNLVHFYGVYEETSQKVFSDGVL